MNCMGSLSPDNAKSGLELAIPEVLLGTSVSRYRQTHSSLGILQGTSWLKSWLKSSSTRLHGGKTVSFGEVI